MVFKKGDPNINRTGLNKGCISPIAEVKRIFKENPERFQEWLEEYMKDPNNRKHIVEMIDGKPKQNVEMDSNVRIGFTRILPDRDIEELNATRVVTDNSAIESTEETGV